LTLHENKNHQSLPAMQHIIMRRRQMANALLMVFH